MSDEIFFNQEFYELDAINQACKDYEHIAEIQIETVSWATALFLRLFTFLYEQRLK